MMDTLQPAPAAPDILSVEVPLGARVMVFADVRLRAATTPATAEACRELIQAIEAWSGPGVLICNGGLFDDLPPEEPAPSPDASADAAVGLPAGDLATPPAGGRLGADPCQVADILAAHPRFVECVQAFSAGPGRRFVVLPGFRDPELAWSGPLRAALRERLGAEVALAVDLDIDTAAGGRQVRVEPGTAYDELAARRDPRNAGEIPLGWHLRARAAQRVAAAGPDSWMCGLDSLDDPASFPRFLGSRLAYRKLGRRAWLLLLLVVPALALRVPFDVVDRAHQGLSGASRLEVTAGLTLLELVVFVLLIVVAVRQAWNALAEAAPGRDQRDGNAAPRAAARQFITAGRVGLVTAHTGAPELAPLADGFYANTGGAGDALREVPTRLRALGLPAVFLATRQVGWLELEAGNELHARLVHGGRELPGATWLERLAAQSGPRLPRRPAPAGLPRYPASPRPAPGGHPVAPPPGLAVAVVAAFPHGEPWPPVVTRGRQRAWVRRLAALFVAAAGFISLISALSEPIKDRLAAVRGVVPIAVPEAATALTALGGLALLLVARGVRRGQRRAWVVCEALLLLVAVLHLVKGVDVEETVVSLAAAGYLWVNRRAFAAASDLPRCGAGCSR